MCAKAKSALMFLRLSTPCMYDTLLSSKPETENHVVAGRNGIVTNEATIRTADYLSGLAT